MKYTNNNKDLMFISFRGKDERYGFLIHLKQKLIDGNVNVFIDDNLTGQRLENLFGYIRKSKIAIVIFSKNYAESKWCLDELVEISKCYETEHLAVLPIFHKVEVSSVKEPSGKFGEKFLVLQKSLLAEEVDKKKIRSRIRSWKRALKMITGIAGLTYKKNSPENAFVEQVFEEVMKSLAIIAAEERGNNTDLETIKTSLEKELRNELKQITLINFNQLNINIQLHRSKSFDAKRMTQNPEGYNQSNDLKHSSGALKRSASFLDSKDQLGPFPFEAIRVQKQVENRQSNDKEVENKYRGGKNYLSSLVYCFSFGCILLLVIQSQKFRRNETSIARN